VPASTLYARFFTPETEIYRLSPEEEARLLAAGKTEEVARMKAEERSRSKSVRFIPNYELPEGPIGKGKRRFSDTIVLDEASMLPTWLLKHLRRMCNTLILVGDPHQLPPVGDKINPDGYFTAAVRDERLLPVVLQTVMRQADGSPVLDLATHIRNGRFPDALVRTMMPQVAFADWFRADRKLIAFTNAHRRAVNMVARRILGHSGALPKPGDLLVCNTNTDEGLLNGSEVKVLQFSWKQDTCAAKNQRIQGELDADLVYEDESGQTQRTQLNMGAFLKDLPAEALDGWKVEDFIKASMNEGLGHSFSYGYCITAHKAQGSEWDEVCVIDERYVLKHVDPSGDMARRWLYTAVTRAAKRLVFADYRWINHSGPARKAA
jgi:exodeoxyribonuclease V